MSRLLKKKSKKQDLKILNCIRKTNEKGKPSNKGTPCGFPSSIWEMDLSKPCVNMCVDKIMGVPKDSKQLTSSQRESEKAIHDSKITRKNKNKRWDKMLRRVKIDWSNIKKKDSTSGSTSGSTSEKYYSALSHISDVDVGGAKRQRRRTAKRRGRRTTKRQRRRTTKRQRR